MSEIYWLNPISGSFTNPGYWSGDVVPGASDDAIINAVGERRFTVTVSTGVEVNSIQTSKDARLSINHGTFVAEDGTGSGDNAGIILVQRHGRLRARGEMTNTGSIVLGAASGDGTLLVGGYLTLSGGGELIMNGDGKSLISDAKNQRYERLLNLNNTISGSGTINVYTTNNSAGIIDANAVNSLVMGGLVNNGLVEASGAGGLSVARVYGRPGATFLAMSGSKIEISYGVINQATLASEGSGIILGEKLIAGGITNESDLRLYGSGASMDGIINNVGAIFVANNTYLGTHYTEFIGGGSININSGGGIGFYRNGGTLTNVDNTITGDGNILAPSESKSMLINESDGIIDEVGSSTMFVNGLTMANTGTIECTGGNGIDFFCQLNNDGLVVASDGTVTVGRTGETYNLTNSGTFEAMGRGRVHIEGAIANIGVFSVQAGGVLTADQSVTGSGVAIVNVGTLDFASSFNEAVTFTGAGTLELAQSQAFTQSVTGFSGTGKTTLDLGDIGFVSPGEATFSGNISSGVLTVTDGTHTAKIDFIGNYLGSTFVASSDGHGGTDVVAQNTDALGAPVHAFISAMATFGLPAAQANHAGASLAGRELLLTAPRAAIA
jgi:hypothetical protein